MRVVNEEIRFELVPLNSENVTHLSSVRFDPRGAWHSVELRYVAEQLSLTVDYRHHTSELFGLQFELEDRVMIGSGQRVNTGESQPQTAGRARDTCGKCNTSPS